MDVFVLAVSPSKAVLVPRIGENHGPFVDM